jgi:queuine tRNA-ribosyltransferase
MFTLLKQDKQTHARLGKIATAHGEINTPNFMPVGTGGAVKTLCPAEIKEAGIEVILSNAYHLFLRPGGEIIKGSGGLHKFISWDGPILTDSGGYQVFSLAPLAKVRGEGVEFQSHIDGAKHFFTPEKIIEFQMILGSDMMMVLDECLHYPCQKDYAQRSLTLTLEWARRSKKTFEAEVKVNNSDKKAIQHPLNANRCQLFGIVQGGTYLDLRKMAVEGLLDIDFDGYAIGGLSVGEPRELMYDILKFTAPLLPKHKTRYLMGVGTPQDILEAVDNGIDIFDCVVPTRNGRNGTAFTSSGKVLIRNSRYTKDFSPIDKDCDGPCCQNYTRAYLHHLFSIDEILGLRLMSLHNLKFYAKLMHNIQTAIGEERFLEFKKDFLKNYNQNGGY